MTEDRSAFMLPVVLVLWVVGAGLAVTSISNTPNEAVGAQPTATPEAAFASPTPTPSPVEVVETYDPPRRVEFSQAGSYVGVRFDEAGEVIAEHPAHVRAGSTAPTTRLVAVRDARYFLITDGIWVDWYMPAERVELMPDD